MNQETMHLALGMEKGTMAGCEPLELSVQLKREKSVEEIVSGPVRFEGGRRSQCMPRMVRR